MLTKNLELSNNTKYSIDTTQSVEPNRTDSTTEGGREENPSMSIAQYKAPPQTRQEKILSQPTKELPQHQTELNGNILSKLLKSQSEVEQETQKMKASLTSLKKAIKQLQEPTMEQDKEASLKTLHSKEASKTRVTHPEKVKEIPKTVRQALNPQELRLGIEPTEIEADELTSRLKNISGQNRKASLKTLHSKEASKTRITHPEKVNSTSNLLEQLEEFLIKLDTIADNLQRPADITPRRNKAKRITKASRKQCIKSKVLETILEDQIIRQRS